VHKLILSEPAGQPFSRRGGIVANDNLRIIYAMRVFVLALDGVFDTGLTVLLDALGLANKFAAQQMGGTLSFQVSIVGGATLGTLLRQRLGTGSARASRRSPLTVLT
jgi:hypothetical protein